MDYTAYFQKAKNGVGEMLKLNPSTVNEVLKGVAKSLVLETAFILTENNKDLDVMNPQDPKYDRLKLTETRITDIANEMTKVAELESPLGKSLSEYHPENGLDIQKISVPLGVVGVIYEARPNVTADVFALCFKTGNVALLKGGSDAEHSNQAIMLVIHNVLEQFEISRDVALLLPPDRSATEALLNAAGFVDVLIPRGSQSLINYVRLNSKIPVIETGAGIVHTFFDASGDLDKGKNILYNSKTRRVSVCNALDCLIIHQERLSDLPALLMPMSEQQVEVFADPKSYAHLKGFYPEPLLKIASPEHFGTEFLSYKMAVKTVGNMDDALTHIAEYSSKHSEAIISENKEEIERFLNGVDAAAVYANASTAFTDGAQFGLGAEIGISTQKLHARGPMGLAALTTYKWLVRGKGQVRI
jgi:glutamate-5-semialdehyde dehydrogenase